MGVALFARRATRALRRFLAKCWRASSYRERQGTGCDDTNAFAEVTPDGKVDLFFLGLEAVTDSTQVRARKNCVAKIKVKVPEGYQIAPKTVFFDGQTRVSPEGSSSVTARYWNRL